MAKRAERRHHRARLKRARSGYHGAGKYWTPDEKALSRWIDTPCPCSCMMCGNPRRGWSEELTLQERRFFCAPIDSVEL